MNSPRARALDDFRAAYSAMLVSAEALRRELDKADASHSVDDAVVRDIIVTVAAEFGATYDQVRSRSRVERVARARLVAMFCVSEITGATDTLVASHFGRCHNMVWHARKQIESALETEPPFAARFAALRARLQLRAA